MGGSIRKNGRGKIGRKRMGKGKGKGNGKKKGEGRTKDRMGKGKKEYYDDESPTDVFANKVPWLMRPMDAVSLNNMSRPRPHSSIARLPTCCDATLGATVHSPALFDFLAVHIFKLISTI
jgi:hypothetical protein